MIAFSNIGLVLEASLQWAGSPVSQDAPVQPVKAAVAGASDAIRVAPTFGAILGFQPKPMQAS